MKRFVKWSAAFAVFCAIAGTTAYLTLMFAIRSQPEVVVPDLSGMEIVAALERLDDLNLDARVAGSAYSDRLAKNRILSQSPEAGSVIKSGREVRLTLSKGLREMMVPDTIRLREETAQSLLRQSGFAFSFASRIYDKRIPPGHVITSSPDPGTPVAAGTKVALLISRGKRPTAIRMPDVRGMDTDAMMAVITQSGLRVKGIRGTYAAHLPLDRVMEQMPAAGAKVRTRSGVYITINRKPEQNRTENIEVVEGMRLLRYRLPHGLVKSHVRGVLSAWGCEIEFINDVVPANRELFLLLPGTLKATVALEENGSPALLATFDPFASTPAIGFSAGQYGHLFFPPDYLTRAASASSVITTNEEDTP